ESAGGSIDKDRVVYKESPDPRTSFEVRISLSGLDSIGGFELVSFSLLVPGPLGSTEIRFVPFTGSPFVPVSVWLRADSPSLARWTRTGEAKRNSVARLRLPIKESPYQPDLQHESHLELPMVVLQESGDRSICIPGLIETLHHRLVPPPSYPKMYLWHPLRHLLLWKQSHQKVDPVNFCPQP
ncbi:hypothetical protein PPACK8108_LOCUS18685, partial [Phakopsora pachyrhizi]